MADLTQTAANVSTKSSNPDIAVVQVGEAITQGNPVYSDSSDSNKYKKAVTTDADTSAAEGIALTPADDDEWTIIQRNGNIDLGATLTIGETYYVSNTAGNIMPSADVSTGEFVTSLGVAVAADSLKLDINASGVARA